MTVRAIARYVIGTLLFVGGLVFVAFIARPDVRVGLTLIGSAVAYAGLDLLRIRPTDRRATTSREERTEAPTAHVSLRDGE